MRMISSILGQKIDLLVVNIWRRDAIWLTYEELPLFMCAAHLQHPCLDEISLGGLISSLGAERNSPALQSESFIKPSFINFYFPLTAQITKGLNISIQVYPCQEKSFQKWKNGESFQTNFGKLERAAAFALSRFKIICC